MTLDYIFEGEADIDTFSLYYNGQIITAVRKTTSKQLITSSLFKQAINAFVLQRHPSPRRLVCACTQLRIHVVTGVLFHVQASRRHSVSNARTPTTYHVFGSEVHESGKKEEITATGRHQLRPEIARGPADKKPCLYYCEKRPRSSATPLKSQKKKT